MSMKKYQDEPVTHTSANLALNQVARLREFFPECITEGKIDFDKLRDTLGDEVDSRPERYSFTWAGKRDAIRLLQTPSRATLNPCPKESINFEETGNHFIEGDNLEVLKLLYKSYFCRVKMIYIDPPYNTGKDFIYPDNFTDPLETYLKLTVQKDGDGNMLTSNPESSGRFHSAWLSMMYPRLFLARQLLGDDGVIFVSIDDHEVHNLRMVMNEIFGEENFVANIIWQKKFSPQNDAQYFSDNHDHILLYAKRKDGWKRNLLPAPASVEERYSNPDNDPRGSWSSGDISVKTYSATNDYPIKTPSGRIVHPPKSRCWMFSKERMDELIADGRIWFGLNGSNVPRLKQFRSEVQAGAVPLTIWLYKECGHNQEAKQELKKILDGVETIFDTPKPVRLISRMLQIATSPNNNHIILDFFAGSCTTAQAVLEMNRKDGGNRHFIMVQLPEPTGNKDFPTIAEIGKERIRRIIARMKAEDSNPSLKIYETPEDDLGFKVFKLAESNYKPWIRVDEKDTDAYAKQMELFADPLVPTWKPENLIWEVAIKEGYSLNSRIEPISGLNGNTVYRVTDTDKNQSFCICLEDNLTLATFKVLGLGKNDLFICRDVALDDELAANLTLQCRLKTI